MSTPEGRQEDAPDPLERWAKAVGRELGLGALIGDRATIDVVLGLARDVAHGVARPAAPLTAYLLGLAAGQAADPRAATGELADRIGRMARSWPAGP